MMWRFVLALSAVLATLASTLAGETQHSKAFWQSVLNNESTPPSGTTARELAPELVAMLGSSDPETRDDLAATILTSWIYRKKLLEPDDLRQMISALSSNLRDGVGQVGSDGVLRRSFSALILSAVAARDNEAPFLTVEE